MSKKTKQSKQKGKGFNWWTDSSSLGLLGGFGATYFALVPLANHPLHWLLSFAGGLAGYGGGLLLSIRQAGSPGSGADCAKHPALVVTGLEKGADK